MKTSLSFAVAALLVCVAACTNAPVQQTAQQQQQATPTPAGTPDLSRMPAELQLALASITTDDLLRHIKRLSSDEFEGRAPGTPGEELTVNYLTGEFQRLGLKPGNPDGTYIQKVPLVGFRADPQMSLTVGDKQLALSFPDDYVAVSRRFVPETKIENSDVVFVGYGVVAPEYNWDDYKGVDVRGKTVVMLVNDPPVPDPNDPTKLDPQTFKGNAMTYYGRWTYKYEEASRHGAAAAFIVHETGPAGYPYEVVKGSRAQENFDIQTPDKNMNFIGVEGWFTLQRAQELFTAAGQNFDDLKRAAASRDFRPVSLPAKANIDLKNTLRQIDSQNVIARLEGSDPNLKNEYIIYTAHWDHLGRDEKLQGDQIYNGARDNASGTAALLELAEAYTKLQTPPRRSVLFLAVTGEEKNLLGAKYYATHPLYPLEKTLADFNMDELNVWGRTHDITIVGLGNSTLDDVAQEVAALQGRTLRPDPSPEKGFFYRSDHFEFAKQGVPALYPNSGIDFLGRAAGYGQQKLDDYDKTDYHKPSDEVKPDWDLSGAVEDVQFLFVVGYRVAGGDRFPEWKPGTEFKAQREKMLGPRAS